MRLHHADGWRGDNRPRRRLEDIVREVIESALRILIRRRNARDAHLRARVRALIHADLNALRGLP